MKVSPENRRKITYAVAIIMVAFGAILTRQLISRADLATFKQAQATATLTVKPSKTPTPTKTPTLGPTNTAQTPETPTATATNTPVPPTATAGPSVTPADTATPGLSPTPGATFTEWPGAPACPDVGEAHNFSMFHTLWDSVRGCHYDHEHGISPFTPDVAAAFPGFDLQSLMGGVQIGHTNPSSPLENTAKHGGFKWQVNVPAPHGCEVGFESGTVAISAAVIQFHNFGDYAIEFNARVHSAMALLRQCKANDPTDFGYVYTVQHVDYGQRVVPYQGMVAPYPDTPAPAYNAGLAPYFSVDCVNGGVIQCRTSRAQILSLNLNTNSIWTSKSAFRVAPSGSTLLSLLFRVRDIYAVFDWNDQTYPFTFVYLCSADGGITYQAAPGCRYNNSTSTIHEVQGVIPAEWDNLIGFDTDARVGRITGEAFTTSTGALTLTCSVPGMTCFPLKLVNAFVGFYSTELSATKVSNPTPADTPERDIYFCAGLPCAETDPGAVSSGWIGSQN